MKRKGVTIVLIFYLIGIGLAGYGLAEQTIEIVWTGVFSLVIGVIICLLAASKPTGWMGLTKEKLS